LTRTFTVDSKNLTAEKNEGEINFSPSFALDQDQTKVDANVLWKKVTDSVQRILEKRFADSRKRTSRPHVDRLAFACPYCGDSAKDAMKKRGNLFYDSMNFHCFNGDCKAHMSLSSFLEDQGELGVYTADEVAYMKQVASDHITHSGFSKIKISQNIESLLSEEAMNLTVSREVFMSRMNLKEIKGSRIENYLRNRLQFKFENFAFDPKKGLVYVFNLTHDKQRIIGYQVKTFNKRCPYLTYKTSAMHKELKIYNPDNIELLTKMDEISTVFNVLDLDINKTITIFEGPLDSFLFPNATGVCSAKNDFPFDVDSKRYFYDNDETGKEWAMRRLNEGYQVFMWRKYIEDNELGARAAKIKDLNDLLIEAKKHNLKLKPFSKYFSDDKYDMVWL